MLQPNLTIPTPLGWIVLPSIPGMSPSVYGSLMIKSCFLCDKYWVQTVSSAKRFRRLLCIGDSIRRVEAPPKWYSSSLLSIALGRFGWLFPHCGGDFCCSIIFKLWMKGLPISGRVVIIATMGIVRHIESNVVWVGLCWGPKISGRLCFFLIFDTVLLLFCNHYSLIECNSYNGCDSVWCGYSYKSVCLTKRGEENFESDTDFT